ncbi:semaphorin-7A [Lepisosteus oculatus]|uniref:semaphorin-7A n=1 Tax=Lepisosteus oculatus TaxID=7918 RepID=UPI00371C0C49
MRTFALLGALLSLACCWAPEKQPRLQFVLQEPGRFIFPKPENYTTVLHQDGSDVIYIGGQAVVYALNFTDLRAKDPKILVTLDENAKEACLGKPTVLKEQCENFITVIQRVNDSLVVCGTNAGSPKCWLMVNDTELSDTTTNGQMMAPADISPPFPSQRVVSLSAEGNLYSALSATGRQGGFIRRAYGSQKLLKSEDKWLHNPQFAGAAVIPAMPRHLEEIYFFFSEINRTATPDEDPYRARIGRVCLVDEGGSKTVLPDSWTTFLKARVRCGVEGTPQQYNRFKEAYVLTSTDKKVGVLYGIFSNAWDITVVCAYSIEEIDQSFGTSKLKGYTSPLPAHRPGTCAFKNVTSGLAAKTLGVIRDHPEIEDVIRPLGKQPLALLTSDRFTKMAADTVLAVNDEHYSVLYLGTGKGKVLKVLHTIEEVFIISQYSLFAAEAPVSLMTIDSHKGHLYVGTSLEVQRLPLADCQRYGNTCRDCVLSRDPYCGWDAARRQCTAIPPGYNSSFGSILQNLDQSNTSVCGDSADLKAPSTDPKEVLVNPDGPILLPCPVRSYHASYTWEKDNCQKRYPCSINGGSCVLAPTPDLPLKDGVFRCMALEDGHKEEVVSYRLVLNSAIPAGPARASLLPSLLVAAAALWLM